MKFVFFSDIHANLPALEAFFEDVEQEAPDAIYCLGDLVGYNVWPNEVTHEIRKRAIPTIMGNHEEFLLKAEDKNPHSNKALTRGMLDDNHSQFLKNLPREMHLSFVMNESPFNVLLVHGSVKAINDYMVKDYPENEVLDMLTGRNAHIMLCGHTHKPFHRTIMNRGVANHVINIGSVGKPKDGDPRLCYVILEWDQENFDPSNPEAILVTFKRVRYDVEKAAKAIENSNFDAVFADALRQAK
ncbi:metallophosphoesterase family protein [Formosa haliotis]|uniref:metallophosphoesterase family protein n=1 Tax=Formosa haliotis TaxID=1555194 RepID=UPI0008245A09|nr:metallophosphoesterase family protein [Formosa haliotis]